MVFPIIHEKYSAPAMYNISYCQQAVTISSLTLLWDKYQLKYKTGEGLVTFFEAEILACLSPAISITTL